MNFIMATLTEVSSISRNIIKWGTIALVIMALIPGAISLTRRIYLALNPPPPPPPTVKYGKLPKLNFPETSSTATPEYKLETISGGLPSFPDTSKVYLVGINKSRLLVLDRMNDKVVTVGLLNEPVQLDERIYRYVSSKGPIDMIFDVITGAISYRFDWTVDRSIYSAFNVPVGNTAVAEAKSFLGRLGVLPDDLANGTTKIEYLAATGSAMIPAISPYEANFVRIDFFRADKEEQLPSGEKITMKIVTAGADTSPVNVIISGLTAERRIVQANYYYSQILGDDFATYPLKSADTAWKELVSGGGFIAKRTTDNTITVRRVSLAYFESNGQQPFLQPVYVFEGDAGYTAYVQAVDSGYVVN
jgi:hypothetical protein